MHLHDQIQSLAPHQRQLVLDRLRERRPPDTAPYALASAQRRIWFLQQLAPEQATFNIPLIVHVPGARDVAAWRRSLDALAQRHPVLRTRFHLDADGEPLQQPQPWTPVPLPVRHLDDALEPDWKAQVLRLSHEQARVAMALAHDPVWRVELLTLGRHGHALLITAHHIVLDGWSIGILLRDLVDAYFAVTANRPLPSPPPRRARFSDFVQWEQRHLQGDACAASLDYWRQRLDGAPVTLDLPADRPRPTVSRGHGAQQPFALPLPVLRDLKAIGRAHGATVFMTLAAAFCAWLFQLTGQDDLIVGTVVSNRPRKEFWDVLGMFANTVPLRANVSGDPTFGMILDRVRQGTLDDYRHADVPFDRIVDVLQVPREASRNPLFQVALVFQNSPWPHAIGDVVSIWSGDTGAARFDLTLTVYEDLTGLGGAFEYSCDLFDPSTIARIGDQFVALLEAIARDPDCPLSRLPVMTAAQRRHVLSISTGSSDVRAPRDLSTRIAARAQTQPAAIAVMDAADAVSYERLDEEATRFARYLLALGVRSEACVGVCLPRDVRLVHVLLAVMRAGGCYVPLDPQYPRARLAWMMQDASVDVAITTRTLRDVLPDGTRCLLLDDEETSIAVAQQMVDPLPPIATPSQLAYVLYTSGSTGRPKGVAIEHRNASALIDWAEGVYGREELSGVLAATSINWDLSVFELWVTLSLGGTAILTPDLLAPLTVAQQTRVRLINTVPSAMAERLRAGDLPPALLTVNLAGEPLPSTLVDALASCGVRRICNLYGPTETTTYATATADLSPGERPAIGQAIAKTQVYVVSATGDVRPLLVPGEIAIGGAGVARGYLGRPDLTAARFVPDPFGPPGARLYLTGDLARYRSDGQLEFLGRRDQQIKLRGHRVELGEVEAALRAHPHITEAVAIAVPHETGGPRLVAYVVAHPTPSAQDLRAHLGRLLPEYMLPGRFIFLSDMPRTATQKIDRQALAARGNIAPDREDAPDIAPRDALEESIAGIWRELLDVPRIGVHDDFFTSGGHSLLATRAMARTCETCGITLPMRTLFEGPTVAQLAERVRAAAHEGRGSHDT